MKVFFKYLGVLAGIFTLCHCANPIPPSGGEEDTTPPRLISESSTPNLQSNFSPKEIILVFDEWIQVKEANKQVLISPPLAHPPKIRGIGKEVTLTFHEEEVLKPNTTYSIQFGEAIQDINESNPADALTYVFSTGAHIDSLIVSGRVLDLDHTTPLGDVMVMLYDQFGDSLPLKEKPFYAGKTNDAGVFTIKNVRADSFKVVAIQDQNKNYLWDEEEAIAFVTDTLILTDSLNTFPDLILFKEDQNIRIKDKTLWRNKVVLRWTGNPARNSIRLSTPVLVEDRVADSMVFWLEKPVDSAFCYVKKGHREDTLLIKKGRKWTTDTSTIQLDKSQLKREVNAQSDTLYLTFTQALSHFDTSLILWEDTLRKTTSPQVIKTGARSLGILHPWSAATENKVILLPGAITGMTGKSTLDTLIHPFFVPAIKDLGTIALTLQSMDHQTSKVVHLMKGEQSIKVVRFMPGEIGKTVTIKNLRPGKYTLEIMEDINDNGRWDSGQYLRGIQPERKWKKELEPLRANWDLKATLNL